MEVTGHWDLKTWPLLRDIDFLFFGGLAELVWKFVCRVGAIFEGVSLLWAQLRGAISLISIVCIGGMSCFIVSAHPKAAKEKDY